MIATAPAGCAAQSVEAPDARRLDALLRPHFAIDLPGAVVLVAWDDGPTYRRAFGMADLELGVAMRPDHVLGVGSITKQVTAIAILRLVDEGRLSLDDDLREHVPEFETHGRAITIEQVLTHTSGLPNFVDRDDFEALARRPHSVDELLALTRDMPLHFEPGEGFYYSDTGYILLGAIIERVTGRSYADYLQRELFLPLGMRDSQSADDAGVITRRADGYSMRDDHVINAPYISMTIPHAAGAVFSTADDLLRWDRALRAGDVIPEPLLRRAWTPRTLPDGTHVGYGFGWKLCSLAGQPTIEHGGFINGYVASMIRLPEDGLTIIALRNNDSAVPDAGELARSIGRLLLTGSPDPPVIELTPPQRAALVGRYRSPSGEIREIVERDGALFEQRAGGPARPLAALSPTALTPAGSDGAFILQFDHVAGARAQSLRTSLRCEPVDAYRRLTHDRPDAADDPPSEHSAAPPR